MIRVSVDENFPITVALIDEELGEMSSGQAVYYDVRSFPLDTPLSPPLSGTLTESTVEAGIYNTEASISTPGNYIIYATCSGFMTNTENITVEELDTFDLSELIKQNRHYNISVEDVIRTTKTPTASQAARNVPKGRTDYIITKIKKDDDPDWTGDIVEGIVYAWYRTNTDHAPYKVGGEY